MKRKKEIERERIKDGKREKQQKTEYNKKDEKRRIS